MDESATTRHVAYLERALSDAYGTINKARWRAQRVMNVGAAPFFVGAIAMCCRGVGPYWLGPVGTALTAVGAALMAGAAIVEPKS